jgi:hypothetical protein
MPTNPCSTCRHWHGDATAYLAVCAINGGATAFDDTCSAWTARERLSAGTAVTLDGKGGVHPLKMAGGGTFITSGPTNLIVGDLTMYIHVNPEFFEAWTRASAAALEALAGCVRLRAELRSEE